MLTMLLDVYFLEQNSVEAWAMCVDVFHALDPLFPRSSPGFGLSPMAVATATKAAQQSHPDIAVFGNCPQLDVYGACGCPVHCCTLGFLIVETRIVCRHPDLDDLTQTFAGNIM